MSDAFLGTEMTAVASSASSNADARFRPYPGTAGGHRQTLLGYWLRRQLLWTPPAQDVVIPAGEDVRLLLRVSWQPPGRAERPTLLIVHGLGGSDRSTYAVATGRHAWSRGWNVVRMNMRGAGDSESLCARLYNAGSDADLLSVLDALLEMTPRLAMVGFSLGANLALLALGRNAGRIGPGLFGVAAVSPSLDLAACADALGLPRNRIYQNWYLKNLRPAYARRQRLLPDLYEAGRERGVRTIREYDEIITAPYGGYRDASDYYARASAGPHLTALDRPTLILAAQDDPLIPAESVSGWPLPTSGLVRREMTSTGGHVGFVGRTSVPGFFWAGERVMRFFSAVLAAR